MITFLLAVLVAIFVPGDLAARRLDLPTFQRIVLALGLGLVFWALQGFIFGFLGFRDLTYVYLAAALILWLKR
ncbi:hypothetical protein HY440_02810 [Candidatus Microgenomates bacterium]|nr:hypothetical protein [Candidatus Microgenomates bacterium]